MFKPFFLFLLIFCLSNFNYAQNTCGFEGIHKQLLLTDSSYKLNLIEFEKKMSSFQVSSLKRAVYKVPIVVHVMETGNSLTSISDQEIKNAIKNLNELYRKIPGSKGDGNGVDITIEFSLAIRDPNGMCTNGINRFDMTSNASYMSDGVKLESSGITDASLKSLISWNQARYYNIWLVSEIDNNNGGAGIQGYAFFASSHGASNDGAVILVNSFKKENETTTAHELGHAFNLYHTFEGDGTGATCPSNSNCSSDGDKVCDTPPHKRSSSNCVSGVNACDNNSSTELFIHNYMDYSSSSCANLFTAGQKTRVLAALTTQRKSFLEENGNLSLVPVSNPNVDFAASSDFVCTADKIILFDRSTCIPNTYISGTSWSNISHNWILTSGATMLTSSEQTPSFTLSTPGIYDVTLEITTSLGKFTSVKKGVFNVGSSPKVACIPTSTNVGNYWHCISNVTFGSINNTTSSYINAAYTDFSCAKSTWLKAGGNYPLSITLRASPDYNEVVEIYIDYNNNAVFDVTEKIYAGSIIKNTTSNLTSSITIPINTVKDTPLRMRVIGDAETLTSQEVGCSSALFVGDVEDYTVFISSKAASVSISASPSTIITYGSSVTFTANPINGGLSPVYKWFINGEEIVGQQNSTFSSSTLLNGDKIYCTLISNLSGVTSSPTNSEQLTMSVTGSPLSLFSSNLNTICSGSSVAFLDLSKLNPTAWSWTFEGGNPATSSLQNPVVSYATAGKYKATLVTSNSLGTGTTKTEDVFITVLTKPNLICGTFSRSAAPANDIGISNLIFGTISSKTAYDDAVYQDYTCSKLTYLDVSKAYPISISTGAYNDQWLRVYIDYNGDGDFSDVGETVFSPSNAKSLFSGTITTPSSPIKDKLIRMRIITDFTNTNPGSCTSTLQYGQVEDYGIIFKSLCLSLPATPSLSAVTQPSCSKATGTFTISNYNATHTYTASPSAGVVISGSTVTAPAGSYTIVSTLSGCSSAASSTVLVNAQPALPATPSLSAVSQPSCSIATGTFTISNYNATHTYTASPSAGVIISGSTVTAPVGSYTIVSTLSGCSSAASSTVLVNAFSLITPIFDPISPTCSNSISPLKSKSVNGINGTWYPSFVPNKTTEYTFTPLSNQCAISVKTTVIILELPETGDISGVSKLCTGKGGLIFSNVAGGTWSSSNPAVLMIDNNGSMKGISIGKSTVTYTTSNNNCSNLTAFEVSVDGCLGISKPQETVISVYPNPATDMLNVVLPDKHFYDTYVIMDCIGKVIDTGSILGNTLVFPISLLADGVYSISLLGDGIYKEHILFSKVH